MQINPPGSYIEDKKGKLTPNLKDEAMAARVAEKDAAKPQEEKTDADAN